VTVLRAGGQEPDNALPAGARGSHRPRRTPPRYADGVDGPVLMGAWCVKCKTEVLPFRNGCCGWCDGRLDLGPVAVDAA
jgi:hypothetical protein